MKDTDVLRKLIQISNLVEAAPSFPNKGTILRQVKNLIEII